MTKTKIDDELRARIDAFIEDISELVRAQAVEAVGKALGGEIPVPLSRPKGGGKAQSSSPKKSGKRIRRSPEDLEKLADTIMKYVEKHEGCRMEALSAGLGMPAKDVRRPLQILLEEGTLKTKGQKRGTQYFIK